MHASRKGRLDGLGVVAVPCGAAGDVVAGLSTLETSAFDLAIIHIGTLVVHGLAVDMFFLRCGPCSGWHGRTWCWLPSVRAGWSRLVLKLVGLKLSFVRVEYIAVFPLGNSCRADQPLKVWERQDAQLSLQDLVHTIQKMILFLFLSISVIPRIAGKTVELVHIFRDAHASLGESQEFLLFYLHEAVWDMSLSEAGLEFTPSDDMVINHYLSQVIPPNAGGAFKVVRSIGYLIFILHSGNF